MKVLSSINDTTIGMIFPSSLSQNDSLFSTIPKLDMTLESTACLAASASNVIPDLPQIFKSAVGQETCIWFNAFSGRIYRDAARSSYFHSWLLDKLSAGLNKGNKPGFIDEFVVESVTFGSTPPLLFNVQWSPKVVPEKKKKFYERTADSVSTTASISGKDVLSSSVNEKNSNGSIDLSSIGNDILFSDSSSSPITGEGQCSSDTKQDCHIDPKDIKAAAATDSFGDSFDSNHSTELPIGIPERTENDRYPKNNKDFDGDGQREDFNCKNEFPKEEDKTENSKYHDDNIPGDGDGDGDEDIECTADMAYRSGLKFKISTRFEDEIILSLLLNSSTLYDKYEYNFISMNMKYIEMVKRLISYFISVNLSLLEFLNLYTIMTNISFYFIFICGIFIFFIISNLLFQIYYFKFIISNLLFQFYYYFKFIISNLLLQIYYYKFIISNLFDH